MSSVSAKHDRRCYRFGPYVADERSRLLWRSGTLIPLTARAFEILAVLIENRSRVVEKDELLERIWPKTTVEENTLARHISTLRKALEELPGHHEFILTVPGHGYQFVADVVELAARPQDLRHSVGFDAPTPHTDEDDAPPTAPSKPPVTPISPLPFDPAERKGISRPAAISAVLAMTAGVGVLLSLDFRRAESPIRPPVLRQVTFQSGLQREPVFSPDARFVAYTSSGDGNSDIWVQALSDPNPIRITSSPGEDSQPDWSPDGQSLVFRSEKDGGGLFIMPARGGSERKIANLGYRPRWSPDGSLILFSSSGHEGGTPKMYVVGANGGLPRAVRPDLVEGFSALNVGWKPGSRDVSVWGRQGTNGWMFLTTPLTDGPPVRSVVSADVQRRIDDAGLTLGRFVWSRSGRSLFFEGRSHGVRNLWRITVDPQTLAWIGGPDRLTTGTGEDEDITVSPDGTRVVFSAKSAQTRLWSFPFDPTTGQLTGAGEPVTSGGAGEQDADALPDGSKLVYSAVRAGRQELWERSLIDHRDRLVIASREWTRTRPHWSPDGTRIAYARRRSDSRGNVTDAVVAVLTVKDGAEQLFTMPGEVQLVPTDWSHDGAQLLGACRPQGPARPVATCVMDVSTASSAQASVRVIASHPTHNLFEQRFSPDQRWISLMAVDSADAGTATVFVMPAAGGSWRAITEGVAYDDKPHWAPNGQTIYFASDRGGVWNIWGRHFDRVTGTAVGEPFRVTSFQSPRQTLASQLSRMQFAVTANHLFLPITETSGELWMLENLDR